MSAAGDDAPSRHVDDGWDERLIVWNATVARVPAPGTKPESTEDAAAAGHGQVKAKRRPRPSPAWPWTSGVGN